MSFMTMNNTSLAITRHHWDIKHCYCAGFFFVVDKDTPGKIH